VQLPLLQAFPFPSTLREVTLHPLSQDSVFIYSSHGKWAFPLLLWSFPPTSNFTSFSTPVCWVGAAALLPSPAGLFIYNSMRDFPSLFFGAQGTPPSLLVSFLLLLLIIQFFFPGWVSVCPGGYADLAQGCLWEYCVPLSSPCGLLLPKQSGSWRLAVQEPSWFLHLTWSRNVTRELGVWRSQSFASSRWFFL
jgi:hypothetical protein